MTPVYVYGIVATENAGAPPSSALGAVRRVDMGRISAVVRDHDGDRPLRRADLVDHQAVLDELMSAGSVLPCRVGVVAPSEDAVRRAWGPHADWYARELRRLGGHAEWAVTATYIEPAVLQRIAAEDQDVHRASAQGQTTAVAEQIELGALVARKLEARAADEGRVIRQRLQQHAAAVADRLPHPNVLERAAYLVGRDGEAGFSRAVDGIRMQMGDWIDIDVTGPLPPYSFVRHPDGKGAPG